MFFEIARSGCRRALLVAKQPSIIHEAGIKGLAARGGPIQRPKPFPYKEKKYNVWRAFIDKTTWRFDENSKIIVVEGPIASGKTAFAKELAKELDMLHLRPVTMDDYYINSYGFDLRQLDSKLPPNCQSCDERKFLEDPHNVNVANFQILLLREKYSQYIDAVCHLMNTGQGVVIERSCFADQVFVEAMYKSGYISKGARSVYYDVRKNTVPLLLKPHLVIYLDVPVSKVQENIQKRSIQYEVKSKALTPQYLADIENSYKNIVLPEMEVNSELLIYDWAQGGDVETVVEDIERIDFDPHETVDDNYSKKLEDWRFKKEWLACEERIRYTLHKPEFLMHFNVPRYDVPELTFSGDEKHVYDEVMENAPGNQTEVGYNVDLGDKNILFKTGAPIRESKWL